MKHNQRITEIIDATAQFFGLPKKVMMSKCRYPEIAIPRMTAMYLAHEEGFTYSGIARRFNRHHGTVLHAVKSRRNDEQTNLKAALEIQKVRELIKS